MINYDDLMQLDWYDNFVEQVAKNATTEHQRVTYIINTVTQPIDDSLVMEILNDVYEYDLLMAV